ncbi:thiol-disulfide oxidoreductase DCC family protein [Hellea balneolensis]|uniref:thiol-disulfide oxidoreductase DCC family protein n=1 Tax=Hellea balneolensis TaxID=287478 RepID=UPI00047ECFDB|nr:DCC1-like thiol-disulfide oxidoreductase family protein [Hellea balneolensis]
MTTPIFLFDGHCVLCSRGVHYVLRYEASPDTRFVAILSGEGRKLAALHNINPENPKSFLWIENGQALAASEGVLALLRHVGGPAKFFRLGRIIPRPIRDWLYYTVAKNRYKVFGRTESCYVPTPENRDRFVLT